MNAEPGVPNDHPELLQVVEVHKRFGGVRALRGASFAIRAGEVHTLVGENGSGKSTLLKIIAGQLRPDSGRLVLDGEELVLRDPPMALARGIVSVTQEMTLAPELSIAENIFLGGRMSRTRFGIDWRTTRRRAHEVLERLGLEHLDVGLPVRRLRPDQQQMVEIARAISMEARILILDEPTSSLTDDEVAALFAVVRRLRDQGIAIVFVSHRLNELFDLASHYTVLRDGITAGAGALADIDRNGLVSLMIGRAHFEETHTGAASADQGEPVLRLTDLSVPGVVDNVSLSIGRGEIVGIAGLVGAGRSELLEAVFGLHRDVTGTIELDGAPVRFTGPRQAIKRGVAFIPSDRKALGLVLSRSVRENVVMVANSRRLRIGFPRRRAERPIVASAFTRLHIVAPSAAADAQTLSGGNQQKVVIAKWLARTPSLMMLDEPTRGVDVGAKAEIYRLLRNAADGGIPVLLSSSETPELLALCDRILVMFRGRLVHELDRASASEAAIARFVAGHIAPGTDTAR
jgi:ABC-type sugar transport system ATPase subunit